MEYKNEDFFDDSLNESITIPLEDMEDGHSFDDGLNESISIPLEDMEDLRKVTRSGSSYQAQTFLSDFLTSDTISKCAHTIHIFSVDGNSFKIPKTYAQALQSTHREDWIHAMLDEFSSLILQQTWELVELPEGAKKVGSRWVFTVKLDSNGEILKYKARFVAKGFSQTPGLDVFETYSPVLSCISLRMLLSLSIQLDFERRQYDVKTAFLHAPVEEDIYVSQAIGFESVKNPNYVYKLKKSLYGLQQSPRNFYNLVEKCLKESGLSCSRMEDCIFYRKNGNMYTILGIYVDDFLMISNDKVFASHLNQILCNSFDIKDLGNPRTILGFNINVKNGIMYLDMINKVNTLVKLYDLSDVHDCSTPMSPDVQREYYESCFIRPFLLSGSDLVASGEDFDYRQAIGSLMYLANACRPDISNAVRFLSTFVVKYTVFHIKCVKRVLKYLQRTSDYALTYKKSNVVLKGSCMWSSTNLSAVSDASWADNYCDGTSNSGISVWLGQNCIVWRSVKQRILARSSMESEYIALSLCVDEVLCISAILRDIFKITIDGTVQSSNSNIIEIIYAAVPLFCDNSAAISVGNSNASHGRSRHINYRHHNVKTAVKENLIALHFIPTSKNLSDFFTKALGKIMFEYFRSFFLSRMEEC
jgi:hypothetical protein